MTVRRGLFWLAAVVAAFSLAAPAHAQSADSTTSPAIRPDSVLATPSEVALAGGTADEVAAQQSVWRSLSPTERRSQAALNHSEAILAESALDAAFIYDTSTGEITPLNSPAADATALNGIVTPMVQQTSCSSNPQYWYTIDNYGASPSRCFGGTAGTYTMTSALVGMSVRLRTGTTTGRGYYKYGGYYYWSIKRGPDSTWHEFLASPVHYDWLYEIHRVQLY